MESVASPPEILARALKGARTQVKLGRMLGLTQPAISKRLKSGKPFSAEEAVILERELGIPRSESRPDLFPAELPVKDDAGALMEANR
jgi:DNA-binding transcriptional regulator YdaS (Cro superfamily)